MTGVVTRADKGAPLSATDHDDNLEVMISLHKSATEPSPTYACMLWADTSTTLLKMRDTTDSSWIIMGTLDTTGAFSDNNLADPDQLSELSDVTITSVADNEVLAYDSTSSKWINQTASEAGLATSAQGSLADSALQDGDTVASLDINGGTIDGATIGGSSAGAGTFTNLTATGTVTLNQSTIDGLTVGQGAGNVATNTAVGVSALAANTTGASNVAVGQDALGANTTASNNTAIGYHAAYANTSGSYNTCVGSGSGQYITTGTYNVCLGRSAGGWTTNGIVTGGYNIHIGYATNPATTSTSNELVIAVGSNGATGKGTNTGWFDDLGSGIYQSNNSSSWATTSDERLKKNIVDNNDGLNKINQLRVRNFEYRTEDEITDLPPEQRVKKEGVQLGVIAQEIVQVLPDCVRTLETGVMTVDPDNLTWYLVNAVKQLSAEVDALKAQLNP
jgi:hypothetical protein